MQQPAMCMPPERPRSHRPPPGQPAPQHNRLIDADAPPPPHLSPPRAGRVTDQLSSVERAAVCGRERWLAPPLYPHLPIPVRESECICSSEKQRLVRVINDLVTVDS